MPDAPLPMESLLSQQLIVVLSGFLMGVIIHFAVAGIRVVISSLRTGKQKERN